MTKKEEEEEKQEEEKEEKEEEEDEDEEEKDKKWATALTNEDSSVSAAVAVALYCSERLALKIRSRVEADDRAIVARKVTPHQQTNCFRRSTEGAHFKFFQQNSILVPWEKKGMTYILLEDFYFYFQYINISLKQNKARS